MLTKNKHSKAYLLIFLCWLTYMTSYLGKLNYSANITEIIDYYQISKSAAGTVPSFFFFSYGIGQVINGIFCKKYNTKWMIFAGLVTSAIINFTIAISTDFAIVKWLWMINGFALSVLWPTLVRLLAEVLPKKDLGKSSVIMGTTVAAGTLVIYALSSFYSALDMFKLAFYTAAFSGITVAVIWLIIYGKAVKMAKSEQEKETVKEDISPKQEKVQQKRGERRIFLVSYGILCFYAVGVNLIKDGLTTWVPSILKEEYFMKDSLSILLTLLLPVLAIFANMYALRLHNKISDYVTHCFVVFSAMSIFIFIVIKSLSIKNVVLMLIGLVVVNFLASSLNSLITVIFPIFMRSRVNSGFAAGMLNGFCYLGSTISSYGLGFIADHFGWIGVFWTLIGFCFCAVLIWCSYVLLKRILKRQDS